MIKSCYKIIFTLSFLFPFLLQAQHKAAYVPRPLHLKASNTEIGIFLGGSYYIGDLNPIKHFNRFTRPCVGAIYRYNFNPRFAAKAFLGFGNIQGDDAYSSNNVDKNRNLSFKSSIYELSVHGEFNFLPFQTGSSKGAITTPYFFGGLGIFRFEPRGYFNSRWYSLQPLGTEGQGTTLTSDKSYSLVQVCIPFGVGLKINTSNRVGIALEWGMRKTFTDYLDDVSGRYVDPILLASEKGPVASVLSDRSLVQENGSNVGRQRGNSFTKDWYSFAGIIITFKLKDKRNECDVPH